VLLCSGAQAWAQASTMSIDPGIRLDSIDITGYPRVSATIRIRTATGPLAALTASDLDVRLGADSLELLAFRAVGGAPFPPTVIALPLRGLSANQRTFWRGELAELQRRWGGDPLQLVTLGDTIGDDNDWRLTVPANGTGRPAGADSTWTPLSTAAALELIANRAPANLTVAIPWGPRDGCPLTCLRRVANLLKARGASMVVFARDSAAVSSTEWRAIAGSSLLAIPASAGGIFGLVTALAPTTDDRYVLELVSAGAEDGLLRELSIGLRGRALAHAGQMEPATALITASSATVSGITPPPPAGKLWAPVVALGVVNVLLAVALLAATRRRR